jgi:hypothetical protein
VDSAVWKRIVKPLLSEDWALKARFAHIRPVGWVIHGVLWEASASDPGFYLWRWRMPLYKPTTVISLSWSERHGGGSQLYDPADESTQVSVSEAMSLVQAEAEREAIVVDPPGGADNIGTMEVRAYGLLLDGNAQGAIEVLERVSRWSPESPWQVEMLRRADSMRSMISDGHEDRARRILGEWRFGCLAALGVLDEWDA